MSALAALPPIERETMLPQRERAADKGFAQEMDSAQKTDDHKPVKKQEQPKRRSDDDRDDRDDAPPPPEAQAQKEQLAPQTVAPAAGGKADTVNSVIGQTVADAAQQVASAMQQGTAVAGNPLGDPSVQSVLTPLEQAVHDLIDQVRTAAHDDKTDITAPVPAPAAAQADEPLPVHAEKAAPVRELPPEPPAMTNPSHVHLVLDEAERLVVTVAVRGDNVIAHVRGGDEQTAAALARNAGSLDNAMRARGLNLAGFQAQRDDHDTPDARSQQQRERTAKQPKFTLEDMQ